ncbi:MAG: hypothetical protein UT43_C0027G0008 [Parcubacteria group bacterium GW2011_GWC1_39_29]|uniref:Uncharacterized protein n=1 Tax=Candidatus Yanofskybacteria bacterium GW2011_GWD1_39_16 TaxID=1619030 RepID=A0A837HS61_9BACT|nr:MAG: hypothetical protein UT35_C0025G0008 [Candidatus Yanofskybacteria bacterium GW2011_GWD1_39_16]KKR14438.1 MAG: hypothetical protein UT43_C0027G0008 [Parcubacteria group bacterium GW2011_GWC1_39_29]
MTLSDRDQNKMYYHHLNLTNYLIFKFITYVFTWDAVSAIASIVSIIVLGVTARVLYRQTQATFKSAEAAEKSANYLEHSIKPIIWFIFRSAKTLKERGYVENNIDRYDSQLIVINGSNFPILFSFKISWKKDSVELPTNDGYWTNNPLHIYPDRMSYPPTLINLGGMVKDLQVNGNLQGEICATVEYRFAARHSPSKEFLGLPETWRFDLLKEVWIGPNGLEDNNIFLPKDELVQKIRPMQK